MKLANFAPRTLAIAVVLFESLGSSPRVCRADWEGTLKVGGSGTDQISLPGDGKIQAKGTKIRLEMATAGHRMVVLADTQSNKAYMLMPEQKLAMETSASMANAQLTSCSTKNVQECFKKKGYKEVGKDTVDGHPCTIYEGVEKAAGKGGKDLKQKIWYPTDLKEVLLVKALTTLPDGKEVLTEIKDVKIANLPAANFKVPAEYKQMTMPKF